MLIHNKSFIGLQDFYDLGTKAVRILQSVSDSPSRVDEKEKLTVESIDNHVYFYTDVNSDRCLALIRQLKEIDYRLRTEHATRQLPNDFPPIPIWLHIQSDGGDLFSGLAMANQIERVLSPVYSIVEGVCASAATLISLAGARRYILRDGYMLIHQFSSRKWGKYEEFKDEMKMQDMLIETLIGYYARRIKRSVSHIRKLLKHDSWFNAHQAIEIGLADEILV